MSELPLLDAQEHARLERLAGRPLTNDEAQLLRREQVNAPPCGRTHCAIHARDYGRDAGAVQPTK